MKREREKTNKESNGALPRQDWEEQVGGVVARTKRRTGQKYHYHILFDAAASDVAPLSSPPAKQA